MCRIEEKIYIGADGKRRLFQDTFDCDRARRRGKRCSKPDKRTREYIGAPPFARDEAASPASNNPPTPTGVGSYIVEERRPSGSGRRPSLKPTSSLKPEIVIQIGGGSRKDKDKRYPHKYSTTYKRSSLGASSTASNEIAVESPGSDASYPIRTGLPETTVPQTPPFGQPHGYTRHVVPQQVHRHTTSASSVTTSQTPSLYTTSETEPESPLGRQAPEYPQTIVHNTRPTHSSSTTSRSQGTHPSGYRARLDVPHNSSRDTSSSRGNADDYSEVFDMYASSGASNASSNRAAASDISGRTDRERRRKMKQDEEEERRLDEQLQKAKYQAEQAEQAKKEVRFAELETGRYDQRERQRNEQKFAVSEKQRAEEREKERQRKREAEKRTQTEPEKRATKKPEREKTQPPTRDFGKKHSGGRHSRRNSMTQADIDERERLLFQEKLQMSLEREAADQREAAELRQQQFSTRPQPHATMSYTADAPSYHTEEPKLHGTSSKRRGSISNPPPVGNLGRTNSTRRASIVQANPPVLSPLATSFPAQQPYSTRPTNAHTNSQPYVTREALPSARYSPSQLANPIGQPPTRTSNTSMEHNPFAMPSDRPIHPSHHPVPIVHQYPPGTANPAWETRSLQNALPAYPPAQAAPYAAQGHSRAQQATRNMAQAYQLEDEWR